MQITIDIPDTLPVEWVRQRVRAFEQSLRQETQALPLKSGRRPSSKLVELLDQGITLSEEDCKIFMHTREWMERAWKRF